MPRESTTTSLTHVYELTISFTRVFEVPESESEFTMDYLGPVVDQIRPPGFDVSPTSLLLQPGELNMPEGSEEWLLKYMTSRTRYEAWASRHMELAHLKVELP